MNSKEKNQGIAFICNIEGKILKIINDNLGIFNGFSNESLKEILDSDDYLKFLDFILQIQETGAEFNLDLKVFPKRNKLIQLKLAGSLINDQIIIVGTLSDNLTYQKFFKQLVGLLIEQISDLRTRNHKEKIMKMQEVSTETEWYEDLTHLNNELVNLQRDLAKKNIRLEKLMEEQKRANAQLEMFVESIPDGIIVLNSKGKILLINSEAEELLYELIGKKLKPNIDFSKIEDNNILIETINEILKTQKEDAITIEPVKEEIWLQIFPKFVTLRYDESPYAVIIEIRDITEFVKFERLRTQFTSVVSHELKNPLSTMNLTVESYNTFKEDLSEEDKEELWDNIAKNTKVLKDLIDDLLLYTKSNLGKIELDLSTCNINHLINNVILQLKPKWKTKNIEIVRHIESEHTIIADGKRIEQVFRILVDNAIKYSPDYSEVVIDIERYTKEKHNENIEGLLIDIKDFGIGIQKKNIMKIFDKFYRTKSAQKVEGSGLGLSISKDLIQLHGGDISVKSEYGKGSTFTIFLPKNATEKR
ncbi:MAG: putative Histidine kinase [Promethearchaeota archaeon]|nr:MAG: putative Histidine kinase [Candidatus Lokiarchaeota archaeon]